MAIPEVEIGPVTIDDAPEPIQGGGGSPVSIDVNGGNSVALQDSDAATRAYKAALGAVKYNVDYPTLKQAIQNNQEEDARNKISSQLSFENEMLRNKLITDVAIKRGSSLTPQDIALIDQNMDTLSVSNDPTSVFEELYARQHVAEVPKAAEKLDSADFKKAVATNPQLVQAYQNASSTLVAKREYIQTELQNIEHMVSEQGWVPFIADQLKQFVPGYNTIKQRSNVDGVGFLDGGLLGENLEKQRKALMALPFPEFKTEFKKSVAKLKEDNPSLAYAFAASMLGQNFQEMATKDLFDAVDAASLAPIAKGLGKAATLPFRAVRGAYEDVAKAAANTDVSKPKMIEATGDVKTAAVKEITQNMIDETGGTADPVKRATDSLYTTLKVDTDNLVSNPGTATQNIVTKFEEQQNHFIEALQEAITNSAYVIRNHALEDVEKAVQIGLEQTYKYYPGLKNNLLDVVGPFFEKNTKTYHYGMDYGDLHGLLFTEAETANNWAVKNGFQNFEIHRKGLGYYIRAYKNFDENETFARNLAMETPGAKDPESFLDAWGVNALRTPEETLSQAHRANRLIAAYTPARIQKVMAEQAKYIKDLARGYVKMDLATGEELPRFQRYKLSPSQIKNRWNDWKGVVEQARNTVDPEGDGIPGYFYKDNAELDYAYMKKVGRLPDVYERQAYFAFKRLAEGDRMLRNIAVYRNKVRLGVETHTAKYKLRNGEEVETAPFDGARREDFPVSESDNILIFDENGKPHNLALNNVVKNKKRADKWRQDVKEGRATIIEIYDTESKPLTKVPGAENSRIRYVMTYNSKSKPIDFEQVPRRGGGHFEYNYDHYIKQAKLTPAFDNARKVFKVWYEGDNTLMPISIRAMGKEIVEHLENVRKALKEGDRTAARQAAAKLPISWDEIDGWFKPQKDAKTGEVNPARFSLNEPFQLIKKGEMIADKDNELPFRYMSDDQKSSLFVDGTKHGSMARQSQVEYTGQRDADLLYTINNEGTQSNPVFNWERANMVDPISSMNRALSKIINSTYIDDYKIYAYENWLRHAENYLKDPLNARTSPFWSFSKGEYKNNVPAEILNRLENSRQRIKQLIGIPSPTDAALQRFTQTMADYIYNRLGNNGILLATTEKLSESEILKDPIGAMRSFVFHLTLGLYNIPQILTQAQTYAAIIGISPMHAPMGTAGALMTLWARKNRDPRWLDMLDAKLSRLNVPGFHSWKPGEFKESMTLMDKTSFDVVQGEYASLDRLAGVKIATSALGDIIEGGTMFFKGGEKMVRYGAWHTAYKEFRTVNPTANIGNTELQKIQQRADLLYGNMSRASSSAIHEGVWSIPTQFVAYQLRQWELFTGKRLNWKERAGLLTSYGAFYGVTVPASLLLPIPFAEVIRDKAREYGYVVGQNWYSTLFYEGGLSTLFAALTGGGEQSKGTHYNVAERWGLQGFPQIRDALRTDHSTIAVMTGAVGTKFQNILYASDPYWQMIKGYMGMSGFSNDPADPKYFRPGNAEIIEMLKEIGSVKNTWQFASAMDTGDWLSKRGTLVEKGVSPYDAVFRYISGLQSQDASDASQMFNSLKDQEDRRKYGLKRFIEYYQRAARLTGSDDKAGAEAFGKAFSWLRVTGWTPDKLPEALGIANRGVEDLITRAQFDYYVRKAVPEQAEQLADTYRQIQELNASKGK
jgi:hypothetical protein